MDKPVYTIGICGGSGAGKSTLARKIFEAMGGARNVAYLFHDSYYRDQSHKPLEERAKTNYDHPDSLETELFIQHIRDLKAGKIVEVPTYDFTAHTRIPASKSIQLIGPRPILLLEGILILCDPDLAKEMDLKVFVDAAPDLRLIRRLDRDRAERGRTVEQVLEQYHDFVRPMHELFVEPSKQIADIIVHSPTFVPGEPHCLDVACRVLTNHLRVTAGIREENPATSMEEAIDRMRSSNVEDNVKEQA